jgi:putative FmdB family regulatory protein
VPIYEYLCEACGRITEVMHKVSERGPTTCGECGSANIARLVSRSAFQLKGGGWYADLYASRKPHGAAGEAKEGGAAKPDAVAAPAKPDAPKPTAAAPKPSGGGSES